MLSDRLELDDGQKIKVKEILEKTRQEIDKIGESVRGAINGVKEKSDKEIAGILTPVQQEKFTALLKEMEKKHAFHGKNKMRGPMGDRAPNQDNRDGAGAENVPNE